MSDDPITMTCGRAVIEEFQSDRAGLSYNRPTDFVTPQVGVVLCRVVFCRVVSCRAVLCC